MWRSFLAVTVVWNCFGALPEELGAQDLGSARLAIDAVDTLTQVGSETVDGGRLAVSYPLPLIRGEYVTVEMEGFDTLDPYVILEAPSGQQFRDDDSGRGLNAALGLLVEQTGIWTLYATSFYEGELGAFRLYVTVTDASEQTLDALTPETVSPEAVVLQALTAISQDLPNVIAQAPQTREVGHPKQRQTLDSLHVSYVRQAQNYMTRVEVGARGIEAALRNLQLGLQMGSLASPYISTEFTENVSRLDKVRRFLPAVGFIGAKYSSESNDGLWGLAAGSAVSAVIGLFSTSDAADVDKVVGDAMNHFDRTIRLFNFNRMVYNDLGRLDHLIQETLNSDSALASEVQHFNNSYPITASFEEMLSFEYLGPAMDLIDRFDAKANAGSNIMDQFEASLEAFLNAAEAEEAQSVWGSRFGADAGDDRDQQYLLFAESINSSLRDAQNRLMLAREAWELFEETIRLAPSLRREMEGFVAVRRVIPLV